MHIYITWFVLLSSSHLTTAFHAYFFSLCQHHLIKNVFSSSGLSSLQSTRLSTVAWLQKSPVPICASFVWRVLLTRASDSQCVEVSSTTWKLMIASHRNTVEPSMSWIMEVLRFCYNAPQGLVQAGFISEPVVPTDVVPDPWRFILILLHCVL